MLKKLAPILVTNTILIGFFIWTSYLITNQFNSHPNQQFYVHWNYFGWSHITQTGIDTVSTGLFIDFPFWLFFTTITINLAYIVKLVKEQETQKKKP